jgi:hypothetical protein
MPDIENLTDSDIIPGRSCGSCTVCCVSLTIDDAELKKAEGIRCSHLHRENACSIYPTRPNSCRRFFCGWLLLKWIREPLRPDRSHVLIRMHGIIAANGTRRLGVEFSLLDGAALKAEGLAESVAAAVAADVPVFLRIPGRPGYTSARAQINDALRHAVATHDKDELLRVLRTARSQARSGPRRRVVIGKE